jgi:S-adenosylmethionine hydrolase
VAPPSRPSCIALLTDFGARDPYVWIMKGAILTINPDARIVDVTHETMPHAVEAAGLHLRSCVPYFPTGTLFVVVVDPGVGTSRRIIYAESARHRFLAPDNGVLSLLEPRDRLRHVRSVTNRKFMSLRPSATFHGRDIFAPVAGWLSANADPSQLGPRLRTFVKAKWNVPQREKGGLIRGRVLSVDRFGNLITDIPGSAIRHPEKCIVTFQGQWIDGVSKTYANREPGEVLAVVGSTGTLEISVNQGSASRRFLTQEGPVTVHPPRGIPRWSDPSDSVYLVETNLDNVTGEAIGDLTSHLFSCGALDVWITPIQMKKSRPGVMVSVLCWVEKRDLFERELLLHSPTFGVRGAIYRRNTLERHFQPVKTKFGKIRIKIGSLDGKAIRAAPEYEDVAAAAKRSKVPFDVVHLAASEAARRLLK